MIRKSLGLALLVVAWATAPSLAVTYLGTPAADAALQYSPYGTSASGSQLKVVHEQIVAPSAIVKAATPINPETVYISMNDAPAVLRSATSNTTATFTVTLSQASTSSITFHYEPADGTARMNVDYLWRSGFLTFHPGETSISIDVPILPSTARDPQSELYFFLELARAPNSQGITPPDVSGATILRQAGRVSIQPPSISAPPVINVSDAGSIHLLPNRAASASFDISLSQPSRTPVTFHYSTVPGSARAGTDFVFASGWLTIYPGQTSLKVHVVIAPGKSKPDGTGQSDFSLTLTRVYNATQGKISGSAVIEEGFK